jgi:hypothetical protein
MLLKVDTMLQTVTMDTYGSGLWNANFARNVLGQPLPTEVDTIRNEEFARDCSNYAKWADLLYRLAGISRATPGGSDAFDNVVEAFFAETKSDGNDTEAVDHSKENKSGVLDFNQTIYRHLKGRTFFKTISGHMGTADGVPRPGDKITLIRGLEMLYIVRSAGRNFRAVGDAFVHGYMFGEMWPKRSENLCRINLI